MINRTTLFNKMRKYELLEIKRGVVLPRVTDFGIAKSIEAANITRTGVFMGTPAYAAPDS